MWFMKGKNKHLLLCEFEILNKILKFIPDTKYYTLLPSRGQPNSQQCMIPNQYQAWQSCSAAPNLQEMFLLLLWSEERNNINATLTNQQCKIWWEITCFRVFLAIWLKIKSNMPILSAPSLPQHKKHKNHILKQGRIPICCTDDWQKSHFWKLKWQMAFPDPHQMDLS